MGKKVVVAITTVSVLVVTTLILSATATPETTYKFGGGKYAGLTEHQMAMVKTAEDRCAYLQPNEPSLCERIADRLIEKYKAENGLT